MSTGAWRPKGDPQDVLVKPREVSVGSVWILGTLVGDCSRFSHSRPLGASRDPNGRFQEISEEILDL